MFLEHSEHSSAPSASSSGCSCDAMVVRDAHPHGQAHTSPQKRAFLRSGRAACALPCACAPHAVCAPPRGAARSAARAPARFLVVFDERARVSLCDNPA